MIHVLTEDWSIHCINYMMWAKSARCLLVWYRFWKSKELIGVVEFIQSLFAHNLRLASRVCLCATQIHQLIEHAKNSGVSVANASTTRNKVGCIVSDLLKPNDKNVQWGSRWEAMSWHTVYFKNLWIAVWKKTIKKSWLTKIGKEDLLYHYTKSF